MQFPDLWVSGRTGHGDAWRYILGSMGGVWCGLASTIGSVLHNQYLHPHLPPEPEALAPDWMSWHLKLHVLVPQTPVLVLLSSK